MADLPGQVYQARLVINLPAASSQTSAYKLEIDLNLRLPLPDAPAGQNPIHLTPEDITIASFQPAAPSTPVLLNGVSNHHHEQTAPVAMPAMPIHRPAPLPAIGQMTTQKPHLLPPPAHQPAPIASTSAPTSAPAPNSPAVLSHINDPRKPLPLVPTERLAAPLSRSLEDEAAVREYVSDALKDARQYSGSRPSPLTQIDRLVARVRLFCHLHGQAHFGARHLAIYWSDLLKFGGMGTAWNEKKAGRRAYKHIYADLLQFQEHALIAPLLDDERGKSLDHLEAAFDTIYGRSPSKAATHATPAPAPRKPDPIDEPDDALLDLAENDTPAASSSKKRKRDDEPVAMPEILALPTSRLTAPSSRSPDEESAVKQGVINELVQTGQWSGTRPSVINSLNVLIARINTLVRIHQKEAIGEPRVSVFWSDCIKYGGVSQAWSSKKAGKAAFRTTYSQLLRHKDHPDIQALLTSSGSIDIRAAEGELAKLTDSGAPASSAAAAPAATTPHSRPHSTPEGSASPEPVGYSELLDGGLTPLASSETSDPHKAASPSPSDDEEEEDEVDELTEQPNGDAGEADERPAKVARLDNGVQEAGAAPAAAAQVSA